MKGRVVVDTLPNPNLTCLMGLSKEEESKFNYSEIMI